jgi:transcription termination/antitermination protein NusA
MTSVLDDLGIQFGINDDEAKVVRATAVSVSVDVATFEIARAGAMPLEAICPATEFYPDRQWQAGETYHMLQISGGNRPMLSVVRNDLVAALLAGVSPEVRGGTVRIMGMVRLPGVRAKVAVAATQAGVDPVAACVGRRANRVRAVSDALLGERVDIVAWHAKQDQFLINALAPAQVERVTIEGRAATAYAPSHQMAAAVGAGGLNSSLAGRLVGAKVEVKPSR